MHGITDHSKPTDGIPPGQIAYTVKHAAEVLDLKERFVWGLVKTGEIRSFKIGFLRRISREDLIAYIEMRRHAA